MDQQPQSDIATSIISDENVLREWGIPQARKSAQVARVLFFLASIATVAGAAAYLAFADSALVSLNTTGFWLVLLLAAATFALRFVQLRAQRADLERFIPQLERRLTGDPEGDVGVQQQLEAEFAWGSRTHMIAIRMIALAMIVLIMVNTYQGGVVDMWRQLVYDGCIAVVITGFAWDQFLFRSELLFEELKVRTEATVRYQSSPAYQEMLQAAKEAEGDQPS